MLGAARRHARLCVPRARGAGGRARRASPSRASPTATAARGAAGVRRRGRRAVRLLHAGPRRRDRRIGCAAARPRGPRTEIREALSGNLCRCTGYGRSSTPCRTAARPRGSDVMVTRTVTELATSTRPRRRKIGGARTRGRRRPPKVKGALRVLERPVGARDAVGGTRCARPHPTPGSCASTPSPQSRMPGVRRCITARRRARGGSYGLESPRTSPCSRIDRVLYFGEPVALVAAEHPEQARRAAESDPPSTTSRSSRSPTWSGRRS